MPDTLSERIANRVEYGEDFILIDTRNPQEWAKSDVKLPEAIRASLGKLDDILSRIPKERPILLTALDPTNTPAPSWRKSFNCWATSPRGPLREDLERGGTLICH